MIVIEFLATFLTIIATILMTKSSKEDTKPLYYTFVLFLLSNFLFVFLFVSKGIVPVAIQMILFLITSIIGIMKNSPHPKRDKLLLILSIPIYIFTLSIYFLNIGIENISWNIKILDTIASSLAIAGSYLLTFKQRSIRVKSFILFIIADILFVYIGYENQLYFFMLQSLFFIFTSSKTMSKYMIKKKKLKEF